MPDDNEIVLVVRNSWLFTNSQRFNGFMPAEEHDFESRILSHYEFMRHGDAENLHYKQPIAYTAIVNPQTKEVFVYQRTTKQKDYGEKKLQGKWSWGVGGHIGKPDTESGNFIEASSVREISEEVEINGQILSVRLLGYINDDTTKVSQYHFGMFYELSTDARLVNVKGLEATFGKMMPISELEGIVGNNGDGVEPWSIIAKDVLQLRYG